MLKQPLFGPLILLPFDPRKTALAHSLRTVTSPVPPTWAKVQGPRCRALFRLKSSLAARLTPFGPLASPPFGPHINHLPSNHAECGYLASSTNVGNVQGPRCWARKKRQWPDRHGQKCSKPASACLHLVRGQHAVARKLLKRHESENPNHAIAVPPTTHPPTKQAAARQKCETLFCATVTRRRWQKCKA